MPIVSESEDSTHVVGVVLIVAVAVATGEVHVPRVVRAVRILSGRPIIPTCTEPFYLVPIATISRGTVFYISHTSR